MTQAKLYVVTDELLIWLPEDDLEMDGILKALQASEKSMPARILVIRPHTEVIDLRANRVA